MRPFHGEASAERVEIWKSSTPYLFGSLAVMLALITVSLIILVCSYRKRASDASLRPDKKPAMLASTEIDPEPKIVVIMAGENHPTYLAKPVTQFCTCSTQQAD